MAESNDSFNRSANGIDFMRETWPYRRCVRARLIRALESFHSEWGIEVEGHEESVY